MLKAILAFSPGSEGPETCDRLRSKRPPFFGTNTWGWSSDDYLSLREGNRQAKAASGRWTVQLAIMFALDFSASPGVGTLDHNNLFACPKLSSSVKFSLLVEAVGVQIHPPPLLQPILYGGLSAVQLLVLLDIRALNTWEIWQIGLLPILFLISVIGFNWECTKYKLFNWFFSAFNCLSLVVTFSEPTCKGGWDRNTVKQTK